MLELLGFLSVMTFWWAACVQVVLVAIYPLASKYLTDIGLDQKAIWLQQKYLGPLMCERYPYPNEHLKYKRDGASGYKIILFVLGVIFWGISLLMMSNREVYIWEASVQISEGLAPYSWWIFLLLVYPALVRLGKFFVKANTYLAKINNSEK